MKLAAVVVAAVAFVAAVASPAAASSPPISVRIDRASISTKLGHTFSFRSTITNADSAPLSGVIAHLNVLSYDPGTYVDPEDWSSHRTIYLPTLSAHAARTITWRMQAVNDGSFAVYVAAVPPVGAAGAPVTGPAIRVDVAKRTTLNAQGIVPLALGIPGALGLLSLGLRVRRRRR
jgi:hypothetical protein